MGARRRGCSDCRAYEQVSPEDKSGQDAGATSQFQFGKQVENTSALYSVATANGEAVLYHGSGSFAGAEGVSGAEEYYVASRGPDGWRSRDALPPGYGADSSNFGAETPSFVYPSSDLSHVLFTADGSFVAGDPITGTGRESEGIFLAGPGPVVEPAWLSEPRVESPVPAPGQRPASNEMYPAGGSPDLSRVYFSYIGDLLPEDSPRLPYIKPTELTKSPRGFYEWDDGALASAATRPAGSPNGLIDPFGAVPAALTNATPGEVDRTSPDQLSGEISSNGAMAFFLSPEPDYCHRLKESVWLSIGHCDYETSESAYEACKGSGCSLFETEAFKDPVELYVRDDTRPELVSEDPLLGGKDAPAYREGEETESLLTGVTPFSANGDSTVDSGATGEGAGPTYMFATPDGSRVFFISRDRLTAEAPALKPSEEEPLGTAADATPKLYERNMETGSMRYLASEESGEFGFIPFGTILASSGDGSRFVSVKYNAFEEPVGLLLWSDGTPKIIAEWNEEGTQVRVAPVKMTADGQTIVFESNAQLWPAGKSLGAFNNSPAHDQVYRYEAFSGSLACLSCGPVGHAPSGDAHLSHDDSPGSLSELTMRLVGSRDMSENGRRVFFDTPEALAAQDTNGQRDVYEWEADGEGSCVEAGGCIFLVSSGTSDAASFYLDSDATGANVFFATESQLAAGDSDESYDVYDARVGGGFESAVHVAECTNSCQPPPSGVLSVPGSAPLTGGSGPSGNVVPAVETKAVAKKVVKKKTKTKAGRKKGRRRKAAGKRKGRATKTGGRGVR